ncbi:MAG: hypothetical protein ABL971_15975 [Vicinamibacterales bacterium]
MKRFLAAWLCASGMLAAANDAVAQGADAPQTPRVEIWGAVTGLMTGPVGSLTTSYSPPLLFDGDFTSRGGQTLTADTGAAAGLTGGVDVFVTSRAGFQIMFDRASFDVTGTNRPYTMALEYESRQPPDNVPRMVTVNRSIAWPDTSGSLTQMTLAFNAVVRVGRPDRLSATLSGGPAYYRLSGDVQPLGFTTFRLGGHSVLFEDDHRLALALESTHAFGFDVGGEISLAAGRHTAIIAGYRYFGGSDADVTVSPTTILNTDELAFEQSIADLTSRLGLAPMRISVSGSRVFVGVRFR